MSGTNKFHGLVSGIIELSSRGAVLLVTDWSGDIKIGDTVRIGNLQMVVRGWDIPAPPTLALFVGPQDIEPLRAMRGR